MKILRITIDGEDRTGKSTFKKALEKATNFKYHIIDRSTISNRMYDMSYDRDYENRKENYDRLEINERDFTVNFILTASEKVIRNRIKATKHEEIDIDRDKKNLEKAIQDSKYLNIIIINTSSISVEEEVEKAVEYLNSLEEKND